MTNTNTNDHLYQTNDIIAEKYRIVSLLGQGSMGATYEVENLQTYQRLALKVVSFRQTQEWKMLELFEREAKVLSQLDHPQIPNYYDYFHLDSEDDQPKAGTFSDRLFFLVRELVTGESFDDLVDKGWHPCEEELKDIATQILGILDYLHSLNPPIIHRDIKPQNIIRKPNGDVYLIDFGAVQDVYRNTMSFSGTFVGTLGYVPFEQFRGKVYPSSDLYALGSTLLYLLTGNTPDQLPKKRMKIDLSSLKGISASFAKWLQKMVAPAFEDRFSSASEALKALSSSATEDYQTNTNVTVLQFPLNNDYAPEKLVNKTTFKGLQSPIKKPVTKISLSKTVEGLSIHIPSRGIDDWSLLSGIIICTSLIFLFILFSLKIAGISLIPIIIKVILLVFLGLVFLFPIYVARLCVYAFYQTQLCASVKYKIQINDDKFLCQWKFMGLGNKITGERKNIKYIRKTYLGIIVGMPQEQLELYYGAKKFVFGAGLSPEEQEWIKSEINDFLESHAD